MPRSMLQDHVELCPQGCSDDFFLGGKLKLYQPLKGYRAAIDPLFLAAAVPAFQQATVLDLGVGVGVASCCLLRRCPGAYVTGVDRLQEIIELSKLNHQRNGLAKQFKGMVGDVQHLRLNQRFDCVISNPPFLEKKRAFPTKCSFKELACLEEKTTLKEWIETCLHHLKPKGMLVLIFRADRTDQLINALPEKGGSTRLIPLLPRKNHPAKRVIVQYRNGSKAPFQLESGWILHHLDGSFTHQTQRILKQGEAL